MVHSRDRSSARIDDFSEPPDERVRTTREPSGSPQPVTAEQRSQTGRISLHHDGCTTCTRCTARVREARTQGVEERDRYTVIRKRKPRLVQRGRRLRKKGSGRRGISRHHDGAGPRTVQSTRRADQAVQDCTASISKRDPMATTAAEPTWSAAAKPSARATAGSAIATAARQRATCCPPTSRTSAPGPAATTPRRPTRNHLRYDRNGSAESPKRTASTAPPAASGPASRTPAKRVHQRAAPAARADGDRWLRMPAGDRADAAATAGRTTA